MASTADLERLYDEHAQALFGFLLHLTRSESDTRDLLQEVFVRMARQPELWRGLRSERAFLLRLAHNLAVDASRRHNTRLRTAEHAAAEQVSLFAPAADPDAAAFRTELDEAFASLPPDQGTVVHLKLWAGLTFQEIAVALGIPLNTAASRYRYGIDKLRAHLRPLYEEIR